MKSLNTYRPPKWAIRFLNWFCHPDMVEDVEGDLMELFDQRVVNSGRKARVKFIIDVLFLFRPGMMKEFKILKGQNQISMFKNYFKIAWRNASRYKGYSMLNLLGLVVGIASSMLILLWINDEESVDQFHINGDSIYQVFRNMNESGGSVRTTQSIPKPLGDLALSEYPEVEDMAWLSWPMDAKFSLDEATYDMRGRLTNPSFLKMFSFNLLIGDPLTALNEPTGLLVSEDFAKQLFGDFWEEKALGTVLEVEDNDNAMITGVFETVGDNSTIQFDWLTSIIPFIQSNRWLEDWCNGAFSTFLKIPDDEKAARVSDKILMEIKDHTKGNPRAGDEELIIHKFTDTYLYSTFKNGAVDGGRIDYVRIMYVVTIFILLFACINFMNLTTARANRRAKEIGVRKVMGAEKGSIRTQFYFEAFFFTTIAMALSILVVLFLLPFFNQLVDKSLLLDFASLSTWYFILSIIISVSLLSGSYPAFVLPKIKTILALKGGLLKHSGAAVGLRRGLVVFQFAISTLLIIGTAVVYKQMSYVLNKDLGLDYERLVSIQMDRRLVNQLETFKTELLRIPEVSSVTATSGNPMNYGRSTSSSDWDGKNPDEGYEVNIMLTDRDFVPTTGVEMLSGRGFSKELADSTGFIINEVMAGMTGYDDPVGKRLSFWGIDGTIIGVVKNFHMQNLHEPIAPLILTCIDDTNSTEVLVKIDRDPGTVLPLIEKTAKNLNEGIEFDYQFLDETYEEQYQSEYTLSTLANIFAIISIIISGLGLLGLASYSADQRAKEIGVRKVHGASVSQILIMLTKDYSKLILLGFIIAVPAGWYLVQGWLEDFEFRTNLGIGLFLMAGLITFLIGFVTVAGKSYHAATLNPVKSLKQE